MSPDYPNVIGSLTHEQRLLFYELFAHNLTVVTRGIWADEEITDVEKIDRMKSVNEVLHRVTSKIRVVRLKDHEWTEETFWQSIHHWVSQNRSIEPLIEAAARWSYDSAVNCADRI